MAIHGDNKDDNSGSCFCRCGDSEKQTVSSPQTCCGEEISGICCIKVLGSDYKRCYLLYENTLQAVKETGVRLNVEYVTDLPTVQSYGVLSLPALVINEKVVSVGKVWPVDIIVKILKEY